MKKIYSIPTIEVVDIELQQNLLTASMDIYSDTVSDNDVLLAPGFSDESDIDMP